MFLLLIFTHSFIPFIIILLIRESGVRSLEKQIAKIARKIAFKAVGDLEIAKSKDPPVEIPSLEYVVTSENLESYLGKPKYPQVQITFDNFIYLLLLLILLF